MLQTWFGLEPLEPIWMLHLHICKVVWDFLQNWERKGEENRGIVGADSAAEGEVGLNWSQIEKEIG